MKLTSLTKPQLALSFAEPSKRSFNAPEGHKRLTINLPEALHKRLRIAAAERECNATDIIVALLLKDLA